MYREDKDHKYLFSGYLHDQAVPKDNLLTNLLEAVNFLFFNRPAAMLTQT